MKEILAGFVSKKLFVTLLTGLVSVLVATGALATGSALHGELVAAIPALAGVAYVIAQGFVDREKVRLEAMKIQAASLAGKTADPS